MSETEEGATLILLYGFFSLGLSEIILVLIAILVLMGPKNVTLVKPIVKSVYKLWLDYQREVRQAEKDMEEMKRSVLQPIEEAEREAKAELRKEKLLPTSEITAMKDEVRRMKESVSVPLGRAKKELKTGPAEQPKAKEMQMREAPPEPKSVEKPAKPKKAGSKKEAKKRKGKKRKRK
jgi:Sec-independent protein translocase protein TatA